MRLKEYHGTHPKPVKPGCAPISWSASERRTSNNVRVHSHTCDCLPTVYELCAAGGFGHIRRTGQGKPVAVRHGGEAPVVRPA
jgi:hypothetical protein